MNETIIKPIGDIHSFVMKCHNKCMICDNIDYKCTEITLKYLSGWIICSTCVENNNAKNEILTFLNRNNYVPLLFLTKRLSSDDCGKVAIKFYRASQKSVINGWIKMFVSEDMLVISEKGINSFSIPVNFIAKDEQIGYRLVSLENILFHNPNFYEEMITSDNLLGNSPIKIVWNDLPETIRNKITKIYEDSSNMLSDSFIY